MSFSPSTLSTIQQVGESLHMAHQAVADAARAKSEQMIATVAQQPMSPESDRVFAELRAVSRMAQELLSIEAQLARIYTDAQALVETEPTLLVALPGRTARAKAATTQDAASAEDVVIKSTPTRKAASKEKPQTQRAKVAPAAPTAPAVGLASNDDKVMAYLKTVLNRRSWTKVTHASMSEGAGIPLGSVGLVLRRTLSAQKLREGSKGAYKLG